MKKIHRAIITLVILVSVFTTSTFAAPSVNTIKNQKDQAEKEMKSLKAELTEIMTAMSYGLTVLKYFPANIYGGLNGMKNLSAPFGGIKFIPTGGVNTENIADYAASPFIYAVGGSWVCSKADISAGNFEKITALCLEARRNYFAAR